MFEFNVSLTCNGIQIEEGKVYNILCYNNTYDRYVGKVTKISVDSKMITVDYSQQYKSGVVNINLSHILEISTV